MTNLDEAIQSFEDEMEKQTALGHPEHVENLEQMSEWLKELKDYRKTWDEIKKQIKEESEFAYADFDEYKYEVLGVDDIDELPNDDFRYGMERAIEIINEYIRVVKE